MCRAARQPVGTAALTGPRCALPVVWQASGAQPAMDGSAVYGGDGGGVGAAFSSEKHISEKCATISMLTVPSREQLMACKDPQELIRHLAWMEG